MANEMYVVDQGLNQLNKHVILVSFLVQLNNPVADVIESPSAGQPADWVAVLSAAQVTALDTGTAVVKQKALSFTEVQVGHPWPLVAADVTARCQAVYPDVAAAVNADFDQRHGIGARTMFVDSL